MNRHYRPIIGILLATSAASCAPASFDDEDDTDMVITMRQPDKDFSSYRTYAITEPVVDLGAYAEDPIQVPHSVVDPLILSSLEQEMDEAGYMRVADAMADNPDVVVTPGVVATNNWGWVSYYPWYGYTGYYWYYPPVPVPVNTPLGSVIITMLDPNATMRDPNAGQMDDEERTLVPVIWTGAMRSLLYDSDEAAAQDIPELMDQMFDQSPYLKVGGAQ
jgi:hypothetical protein